MREMTFVINSETGEVSVQVKGQPGRTCLEAHRLVEELVGQASETTHTREFYQRVTPQERARVKR